MAEKENRPIDLGVLTQKFIEDLRALAPGAPARDPQAEPSSLAFLRENAAELAKAANAEIHNLSQEFKTRSQDFRAKLEEREKRLRAFAEKDRQVVAPEKDRFIVAGRVVDAASGAGLPYLTIKAADIQGKRVNLASETRTDALGYYRIEYDAATIKGAGARRVEGKIQVLDDDGNSLFVSRQRFEFAVDKAEFVTAKVDGSKTPERLELAQSTRSAVDRQVAELENRQNVLKLAGNLGLPRIAVAATATPPALAKDPAPDPSSVKGVGPKFADQLKSHGIDSAGKLADLKAGDLQDILKIGKQRAGKIREEARRVVKSTKKPK